MLQTFKEISAPLQKQIIYRLAFFIVSFILFVTLLFMNDFYLVLPFAAITVFILVSAFFLFKTAALNEYVVISGECYDIVLTAVRRRTKTLFLRTESGNIQIAASRIRKIPVGAKIDVYVSKKTPVYERDGMNVLYTNLAIDVKQS